MSFLAEFLNNHKEQMESIAELYEALEPSKQQLLLAELSEQAEFVPLIMKSDVNYILINPIEFYAKLEGLDQKSNEQVENQEILGETTRTSPVAVEATNLPQKPKRNVIEDPAYAATKIVAKKHLGEYFGKKMVTHLNDYNYSKKTSGISTGWVAEKKDDHSKSTVKRFFKDEKNVTSRSEQRDWIQEYITATLYNRLLPNVTPTIELVTGGGGHMLFRSIHLEPFHTLHEAKEKKIITIDNAKDIQDFEKVVAAMLFAGEVDYHSSNLGIIQQEGKWYAAKIDHGRSAFNFYENERDLMDKLNKGYNLYHKYGAKGFYLNIDKLKKAVHDINNLLTDELEIFIKSRFQKLKSHGLDIRTTYRDVVYNHPLAHASKPERVEFTGDLDLSIKDDPMLVWYQAMHAEFKSFLKEASSNKGTKQDFVLEKLALLEQELNAIQSRKQNLMKIWDNLNTFENIPALSGLKSQLKNLPEALDGKVPFEPLSKILPQLENHYDSALSAMDRDRQKLIDELNHLNELIKQKTKQHVFIMEIKNAADIPSAMQLASNKIVNNEQKLIRFAKAEKWYVDKFKEQLGVMKKFEETLNIISQIDGMSLDFKNGGWLSEIGTENPQEWAKCKNLAINGKCELVSDLHFLVWKNAAKTAADSTKKIEKLRKDSKYDKWMDQIIFKLAMHDIENPTQARLQNVLAAGVSIDQSDAAGDTALMMAVRNNDLRLVRFLVEHGAAIRAKNNMGETPLMMAAIRGHLGVVDYLLKQGAPIEDEAANENTALTQAMQSGHREVVRRLLDVEKSSASFTHKQREALSLYAAKLGDLEVYRQLGQYTEADLKQAIQSGHLFIVTTIITQIDFNLPLDPLLWHASQFGNLGIVLALITKGANLNAQNGTGLNSLMIASMYGHRALVSMLLESPSIKIDAVARNNFLAPSFAVQKGHDSVVKLFFDRALLNHNVRAGHQALLLGFLYNKVSIIQLLLSKYAVVSVKGNEYFVKPLPGNEQFITNQIDLLRKSVSKNNPSSMPVIHLDLSGSNQPGMSMGPGK